FNVDLIYGRNVYGENANWITLATVVRFQWENNGSHRVPIGGVMISRMALARVSPCSIILVHGTWGRGFSEARRRERVRISAGRFGRRAPA
ncbi:MAG: hypothetical protein WCF75_02485, partial [Pseudolabrys sp.]